MVVELCSFYELFLKVVFKKVVFYNEKLYFRKAKKKKIQLIASEVYSLRQVRMTIYIYIIDSHMAPYGASEVAQSTARSNAQFEAERFRKGCRRKNKQSRKCFRRKTKHTRNCIRRKKKHARAVLSSGQWPQSTMEE